MRNIEKMEQFIKELEYKIYQKVMESVETEIYELRFERKRRLQLKDKIRSLKKEYNDDMMKIHEHLQKLYKKMDTIETRLDIIERKMNK